MMTEERYLKRTVLRETVASNYLQDGQRSLRVYLPPGYNELLSYPVVYCQDGEDFFNFGRIATAVLVFSTGLLMTYFEGEYPRIGRLTSLLFVLGMVAICFAPVTSGKQLQD